MLEVRNIVAEMKNTCDGFIVIWTRLRRDSLDLRVSQPKPPKLRSKEKKHWGKKSTISKNCGTTTESITHIWELQREKKEKEIENMRETFPKLILDTKP